jgi:uncharacterized phiE125 gp8 family phage protein
MYRIEPQAFRYTVTPADYSTLISADDVRAFAIVDETADVTIDAADASLIALLIQSAIRYWINYTGVFPLHTDVVAELDYSPGDCFGGSGWRYPIDCWLRYSPIASVEKIWGLNADSTEDELSAADYVVDYENGIIRSLEWPSGDKDLGSFLINYTSGLGVDDAAVPDDVKTAIKMMVTHWFEIRQPGIEEAITIVPHHAQAIMNEYKQCRL